MADAPTTTEITQYKKNVVVLPTAYLKDRGSANLRMFLRKENSGTIFFIGNDPTNNALKLPYNVPCHNNKLNAIAATAPTPPAPADIVIHSQLNATGHYNRAAPIDVANNIDTDGGAQGNTDGYNNIRNFCPDLRCVANEPTAQNNHKITNSGDHTSNFRIYLPNYEDDSQLEGCNFEFIIVCNNSQLERDKQLANLTNFPNAAANRTNDFLGNFGALNDPSPEFQKQIAELGGIYESDRPDSIGSANIEIISHSYITQMYESFAKEKEFHEAFPIPCKFTPYTDDPLTTKAYIHQLCDDDNYAKPDLYGFSPKFVAATHQPTDPTTGPISLIRKIDGLGITDNYKNKYGIHADFRPTNDGDKRSIYDRLNTQGKQIPNKKIAGITHNGDDYTLSKFFNIYKNALNDTTNRDPVFTGDTDYNTPGVNNDVKTAMNFKENPKITNSGLSTGPNTNDNFLNPNGAGRGVVDKRNIFADNVTTSYEPDLPCYGIDINPEEKHLSHRQANMVGTIHCRGSKAFSNNPDNIFHPTNPNPILGDIAGPEVKDGLNPIIPVYNTLRHNDKGKDMECGLGTPCDEEKPFHTIHINLNRLKYPAHNADNDQPTGNSNLVGDVTTVAFANNTLKGILNIIPQMNDAGNNNNNNYNSVSNTDATGNNPKVLLRAAYPNKYDEQDAGGNAHQPLFNAGNPASLFGLHSKDTGRGFGDDQNTKSPAPPLHHPFMRPFGTAGGGAGSTTPFTDDLEQEDATAATQIHELATPDIITTQQKTYADHRQSCVNKQIHIKCNYLEGQWHVEVITPNVHTLGGNQLLHQNPGFRDITFVRGRK